MKNKSCLFALLIFASSLFPASNREWYRLKSAVGSNLPSIEGWCSMKKAMQFIDLIAETEPEIWVDLGTFAGKSVYPVAAAFKLIGKGKVIAVDPWDRLECIKHFETGKDELNRQWWGQMNMDWVFSSFLFMIQRFDLDDTIEILRMTSEEAAQEMGEIDVIHMDGNHSRRISTLDVQIYLPKVRRGGYIWLNDAFWEDRDEALHLLQQECDVVKIVDDGNCILFRKR